MGEDLKTLADRIMQKEGSVRGDVFHTHSDFIEFREGKEGVRKIEEKLKELGYPLKLRKTKKLGWEKEAHSILLMVVGKEIFGWNEEDIFQMGKSASQTSLMTKMLFRYFISLERALKEIPRFGRKRYDFVNVEVVFFHEEEKEAAIRFKNHNFHPVFCHYVKGYITGMGHLCLGTKNIKVKETKCELQGDDAHEFKINWE